MEILVTYRYLEKSRQTLMEHCISGHFEKDTFQTLEAHFKGEHPDDLLLEIVLQKV